MNDIGWPWTADMHSIAQKMRLSEPTTKIWIKIDPYYQQQKCSPVTLLSGNIGLRFMRIFAGIRWRRDIKQRWICWQQQFSVFLLPVSSETLEIRPALLYCNTQSFIRFSVIPKCMTSNDLEWLFRIESCFCASLSGRLASDCDFQK